MVRDFTKAEDAKRQSPPGLFTQTTLPDHAPEDLDPEGAKVRIEVVRVSTVITEDTELSWGRPKEEATVKKTEEQTRGITRQTSGAVCFNLALTRELRGEVRAAAALRGVSMQDWIFEAIEKNLKEKD